MARERKCKEGRNEEKMLSAGCWKEYGKAELSLEILVAFRDLSKALQCVSSG